MFFNPVFMGSGTPILEGGSRGGSKRGGRTPPKMGVEIRGFFGGQKMVKNGQKRCGTEG